MLKAINPATVTKSPAYSQGIEATGVQRMLFVSGQVGAKADGSIGQNIQEQTVIAITNLNAVLAEGGMSSSDIAKLTIYLTDEASLPGFMEVASASLSAQPPATTLLFVKALASPQLLIEVEAIAVK